MKSIPPIQILETAKPGYYEASANIILHQDRLIRRTSQVLVHNGKDEIGIRDREECILSAVSDVVRDWIHICGSLSARQPTKE